MYHCLLIYGLIISSNFTSAYEIFEILSHTSNKYMYVVVIQKTEKFTFIVVLNQKALEIRQMIDMYVVWLLEHYRYINMKTTFSKENSSLCSASLGSKSWLPYWMKVGF